LQLSLLWVAGLYRGLWRAIGIDDLLRVVIAVGAGGALSYSFVIINQPPEGTGSLFLVHTLVLGWLMTGLRSAYRLVDYSRFQRVIGSQPVLIYGAGMGGRLLLRELRQNATHRFHAVGFIDDDHRLQGQLISGLPVLGGFPDLPALLVARQIHTLLISSESISQQLVQQALEICRSHGSSVVRAKYVFEPLGSSRTGMPRPRIRAAVEGSDELWRLRHAIASLRKTAM
jgi:UDP-GlcNAc:undecaprenyl-phosphate GlcNAc-1-phosphate transferase